MTKTVNIPLTELQEIYQGLEAFVLAVPGDAVAFDAWKQQVELRMSAARALGHLSAYVIYAMPKPVVQDEYEYALDHYGLDNWQAEWGNGDIERDIVVKYNDRNSQFDYCVIMDGEDITATLNKGNRLAFESLILRECAQRESIRQDHAYD
jgi:hypothetical protein